MKAVGIILIGLGIAALVYQWSNKEVLVNNNGSKNLPTLGWPMYAGAFAMAAGSFILLDKKKNK